METIVALGMMSGTSLDGLDIAACAFSKTDDQWHFEPLATETVSYSNDMQAKLVSASSMSALDLQLLDLELGEFMGQSALAFIKKYRLKPALVASHGHTIFHQPDRKLTLQIGNGFRMYSILSLPVVYDFRSLDLQFGGEGAPLVPAGDALLFKEFDACLNLGGIANISSTRSGENIAFDITAVNMVLNFLAHRLGVAYDEGGQMAAQGNMIHAIKEKLDKLDYYHLKPPKSTGFEWVQKVIYPLLDPAFDTEDLLHTYSVHAGQKIAEATINLLPKGGKILVTGGGAYNKFLIKQMEESSSPHQVWHLPGDQLIQFKEAIVFAFLGLLRWKNEHNILKSVTGSKYDHAGGLLINNSFK